jgi:plastin-1
LYVEADTFRKFPQFQQNDIFGLAVEFRKLDVDDKGYIDEATAIKATQASERQPYDVVRQALKEVELDSSRRVELEDYVGVSPAPLEAPLIQSHG